MADRSTAIFLWENQMSTLSKRATPLQLQMLRIIEGAVKNAFDAHPELIGLVLLDDRTIERFARSVAKRAVGTLSAQLADRLADMKHPSQQVG